MARCYYFTVNRNEMIWAAECAFMGLHETSMRAVVETRIKYGKFHRKSMRCVPR